MNQVRTRFAPSPTGKMHVGNLRTALYEYLVAKSQDGSFVLRIEDTDRSRYVAGAEEIIYQTLKLVGLSHDEGPDVGGAYGPYVQSQRKELYLPYALALVASGHAYYCFCTKERLESLKTEDGFGGYDRHCRTLSSEETAERLAAGEAYVIRQRVPLTGETVFEDGVYGSIRIENREIEDQVLIKADGYPTYNFANVVDDHLMAISHVVRGSEYLTSTPKYNLLYEALGWEIPSYIHLPLIMGKNEDGSVSKLSKRHGATSLEGLVAEGYLPDCIINYIALLGWSPKGNQEIFTLPELVQQFDVKGISKSAALFDYEKLRWMNGMYIKAMDSKMFLEHAMPYYEEVFGPAAKELPTESLALLRQILQGRIVRFREIPNLLSFFSALPAYETALYVNKKSKTNLENAGEMLSAALESLEGLSSWDQGTIHDRLIALAGELGVKNGTLLWPVRIAASGTMVTPGGAMEILTLLGKEETLSRLKIGLEKLRG